jgi:hypothetical protein
MLRRRGGPGKIATLPHSDSHWMNTTYRCLPAALIGAALAALVATSGCASNSSAEPAMTRSFPQNTLRGAMTFGTDRKVALNGRATSLSPGARVRDQENRIVQPETLVGARMLVHYTLDIGEAQVRDVWILRAGEAAVRPWPTTREEAQTWTYDAETLRWTKP